MKNIKFFIPTHLTAFRATPVYSLKASDILFMNTFLVATMTAISLLPLVTICDWRKTRAAASYCTIAVLAFHMHMRCAIKMMYMFSAIMAM